MPNGDTISIGQERFLALEVFFQPAQIGSEVFSIIPMHEFYKAIQNCDVDIRPHLYSNIVLSGVSTMFPGMKERIHKNFTNPLQWFLKA